MNTSIVTVDLNALFYSNLNDGQTRMFDELLMANWNYLREGQLDKRVELGKEVAELKGRFRDSLGEAAYRQLISRGRVLLYAQQQ
ncbi:MAG: hypothetical protein JST14_08885 [Bacteroidetes bacterium]|nr:hypothetical protein [Bacteroidota bacterium]MBS1979196.1 hypothetical protein [Bacteroidota bacterium]